MKKAKKLLAMILGVILVMGSLSVSAATEKLTVTDATFLYEADLSGDSLDESRINIGNATFLPDNDRIRLNGNSVKFYYNEGKLAGDGTTTIHPGIADGTIVAEYRIVQYGMFDGDTQIQMALIDSKGKAINDYRFYGGGNRYVGFINGAGQAQFTTAKLESTNVSSSSYTFKIACNPTTGLTEFWVDGDKVLEASNSVGLLRTRANASNIAGLSITQSNTVGTIDIIAVSFSVLPEVGATFGETLYYEDFEGDTEIGSEYKIGNNVTASIDDGVLLTESSASEVTAWSLDLGETITGKYVVDVVLRNEETGSAYQRLNLYTGGDHFYAGWNPGYTESGVNNGLVYRNFYPATGNVKLSEPAYNAEKSKVLKVTFHLDTNEGTLDLYFNGSHAYTCESSNVANGLSINGLYLYQYGGKVGVDSIHIYRPVEESLMVKEVEGGVKIASTTEMSTTMAAATFAGTEEAKTLETVAASDITLKPGVVYTVSTADFAGGNFYLWDSALKPLKTVLPISE